MRRYLCWILFVMIMIYAGSAGTQVIVENLTVTKILDGRTISLANGATVQYIGVDIVRSDSNQISTINEKLLLNREVSLEFDTHMQDEQDRLLAYVYVDSISVNGFLIRYGYAGAAHESLNVKYRNDFSILEQIAREEKLGIWARSGLSATK